MKANKPTFLRGGTVKFVNFYSKNDVMYELDVFQDKFLEHRLNININLVNITDIKLIRR
jgi:hypothetical protein